VAATCTIPVFRLDIYKKKNEYVRRTRLKRPYVNTVTRSILRASALLPQLPTIIPYAGECNSASRLRRNNKTGNVRDVTNRRPGVYLRYRRASGFAIGPLTRARVPPCERARSGDVRV